MRKDITVKDLVLMAFYVAVFMVLDSLVNTLPFLKMPNGGSLGISTLALLLASYHLGWKKGLIVAVVSVFAQFITGPMYTPNLLGFVLDYLIAFSAYGLASLFPTYKQLYSGVLITNLIRFISSVCSGVYVWQTPWLSSIAYNATYLIPTLIVGMILTPLLIHSLGSRIK